MAFGSYVFGVYEMSPFLEAPDYVLMDLWEPMHRSSCGGISESVLYRKTIDTYFLFFEFLKFNFLS